MKSKKVFVVKNFKSPYIEEAIFILRENAPSDAAPRDAVLEAEALVTGYLSGLSGLMPPQKKKRRLFFAACAFLSLSSFVWLLLR